MLKIISKLPISLTLFGTCLLYYLLLSSGHHYSIDGMVMFQYAKSLWFDHSLRLNPPVRWAGFDFVIPRPSAVPAEVEGARRDAT